MFQLSSTRIIPFSSSPTMLDQKLVWQSIRSLKSSQVTSELWWQLLAASMHQIIMVHYTVWKQKMMVHIIKLNNMKMTHNKQISIQVAWQGQLWKMHEIDEADRKHKNAWDSIMQLCKPNKIMRKRVLIPWCSNWNRDRMTNSEIQQVH